MLKCQKSLDYLILPFVIIFALLLSVQACSKSEPEKSKPEPMEIKIKREKINSFAIRIQKGPSHARTAFKNNLIKTLTQAGLKTIEIFGYPNQKEFEILCSGDTDPDELTMILKKEIGSKDDEFEIRRMIELSSNINFEGFKLFLDKDKIFGYLMYKKEKPYGKIPSGIQIAKSGGKTGPDGRMEEVHVFYFDFEGGVFMMVPGPISPLYSWRKFNSERKRWEPWTPPGNNLTFASLYLLNK